jgi:hypothetical protein
MVRSNQSRTRRDVTSKCAISACWRPRRQTKSRAASALLKRMRAACSISRVRAAGFDRPGAEYRNRRYRLRLRALFLVAACACRSLYARHPRAAHTVVYRRLRGAGAARARDLQIDLKFRSLTAIFYKLRLRKQRNLFEACCFGQAEHDVHILHRLAGRALRQIVERRNDNGAAGNTIGSDADESHV